MLFALFPVATLECTESRRLCKSGSKINFKIKLRAPAHDWCFTCDELATANMYKELQLHQQEVKRAKRGVRADALKQWFPTCGSPPQMGSQGILKGSLAEAYARGGGGFSGQTPIDDLKKNKNLSFWNHPPFFIQSLPKLLSCFSVLSNLLINLEKLSL